MAETLIGPVYAYKLAYRAYLIAYNAGKNPSRDEVDRLGSLLTPKERDEISYEVERKVGVPAVHPKKGN